MDLRRKVTNAGVKTSERLELENKSSKDAEDHNKGKRKRNSAYSQDTMKEEPKRTRVHAQRKFAQGAGGISVSPQVSPLKEIRSRSVKNDNASSSSSSSSGASFPVSKGERPKTEDFLTFLCLRGTD